MNKFFLLGAAAVMTLSAFAQEETSVFEPAPTTALNMEAYPAGLSSVELNGSYQVNRTCPEFVSLYKNGELVKQVPASNSTLVYCLDGFTKTEVGTAHITFWPSQMTTPYKYTGTYKVVIPAGFFLTASGDPVGELTGEWGIANNAEIVLDPPAGSTVSSLTEIKCTFPGAVSVRTSATATGKAIYYEYTDANGVAATYIDSNGTEQIQDFPCAAKVDGAEATILVADGFDEGSFNFTITSGAFTVTYADGTTSKIEPTPAKYYIKKETEIEGDDSAGWTINPAPGTYPSFTSTLVGDTENYAFFEIFPPEGVTVGTVLRAKGTLYPVTDGVRGAAIETLSALKDAKGNGIYFYKAGSQSVSTTLTPAPGEYEFVVGANADYTNKNPELVYKYTVSVPEKPIVMVASPDPAEKVNGALNVITISFPESEAIELTRGTKASITCGVIDYMANPVVNNEGENGPEVVLTPVIPFTNAGVYVVEISGAAFKVDGVNYPVKLIYDVAGTTSGVAAVEAIAVADVYTIDGKLALKASEIEKINTLAPGLYIVGGKKILVRK